MLVHVMQELADGSRKGAPSRRAGGRNVSGSGAGTSGGRLTRSEPAAASRCSPSRATRCREPDRLMPCSWLGCCPMHVLEHAPPLPDISACCAAVRGGRPGGGCAQKKQKRKAAPAAEEAMEADEDEPAPKRVRKGRAEREAAAAEAEQCLVHGGERRGVHCLCRPLMIIAQPVFLAD